MPQFRPYWWINLISWILVVFTLLLTYHQSISLPKTLKLLVSRTSLLFI